MMPNFLGTRLALDPSAPIFTPTITPPSPLDISDIPQLISENHGANIWKHSESEKEENSEEDSVIDDTSDDGSCSTIKGTGSDRSNHSHRSTHSSTVGSDNIPEINQNRMDTAQQQNLERLVYTTTRDIFAQSLFKAITRLSGSTAHHILTSHVKDLPILLKSYKIDSLVDTVTKMHAQRVYSSNREVVEEKRPWLLHEDASDVPVAQYYPHLRPSSRTSSRNSASKDLGVGNFPIRNIQAPTEFLKPNSRPQTPSTRNGSLMDDGEYSVTNVESHNEVSIIDPYGTYFPYPTLRTILKETQKITKTAIYEFTKKYLPEKLRLQAYEYPASSSLGQWILMLQDAISEPYSYSEYPETQRKLLYLSTLNPNLLYSVGQVHDLVSERQHASTSELYVLLASVLEFIDVLGIPKCTTKQTLLNNYSSTLAADLKKKLEDIQIPLRNTLSRIAEAREKLTQEEEEVSQKYHQKEREVQQEFLLDQETLKGILNIKTAPLPQHEPTRTRTSFLPESKSYLVDQWNNPALEESEKVPDICVWDPDKHLIEYCPGGASLIETVKETNTPCINFPWDAISIDRAIDALNAKENMQLLSVKELQENAYSKSPLATLKGIDYPNLNTNIVIQPKVNKAVPIKAAKPMPSYIPSTENGDLLIDF
ncbi:hypothetical protein TWF694_000131 [Orbilia ellipsospora]|uniref:Uncharacterized protein n=1 Tax=Orbilia ellipsospora TaxID=2528407 RepID=A0AAV9XMR0_9PEZI